MSDELQVTAFTKRFVDFIARRAWLCIGLVILGLLALAPGLGRLHADFTHAGFFWANDPNLLRFNAFERRFGNDDAVVIGVHSPSGVFDMDTATLVQELTDRMWQVPEIIRVDSLSNFNWVHAQGDDILIEPLLPKELNESILAERKRIALAHEILPNYLVSKDGTTAAIFARVKPGLDAPPNAPAITLATRKIVEELKRGDNVLYVGGGPPTTFAFQEASQADLSRLFPTAILIAAFFLIFIMRSASGVLLPIVVVLLSIFCSFAIAGWVNLTQTVMSTALPSILIAVGIADAVHILLTFFRALHRGMERKAAARYSLEKNLLPTFLTSATTAIGFLSFVSANLKPIQTLGLMAGIGSALAWLITQFLVGPLLFVVPFKSRPVSEEKDLFSAERSTRFVSFISRNRRRIIFITVAISLASLVVSLGNEVNSDPMKYFKKGISVRDANEFMEKATGGSRSIELVVDAGKEEGIKDPSFLKCVDAFQSWIEDQPGISRTVSIVDILKSTHRSLHGDEGAFYAVADDEQTIAQELFLYTMGLPQGMDINDRITVKNDALRITVLNSIATSREAIKMVGTITDKAKDMGLAVQATGKYLLYQQTNDYVVWSFLTSFGSSSLVIGIMMVLFLRSFKLGLISMFPNVIPLFASGAILYFIKQPLDLGTVLVGSVSLGIAVDDTIHVLANYNRLRRQGLGKNDAVRDVIRHTAAPLVSTTGILICAFGSFASATFMPNVYFGVLTAITLGLALIADLFFTTALLSE